MTSADASTMTADDQRLADILSLLSSIDERLPKRRVKAAATTAVPVESDVTPAEKPKRARKPSVKAAVAAKAAEPQLEEEDEPTPAPAKPARKPRVKKATVPADSPTTC